MQQLNASFDVYLSQTKCFSKGGLCATFIRITWALIKIQVPCCLPQKPHKMIKLGRKNAETFALDFTQYDKILHKSCVKKFLLHHWACKKTGKSQRAPNTHVKKKTTTKNNLWCKIRGMNTHLWKKQGYTSCNAKAEIRRLSLRYVTKLSGW